MTNELFLLKMPCTNGECDIPTIQTIDY